MPMSAKARVLAGDQRVRREVGEAVVLGEGVVEADLLLDAGVGAGAHRGQPVGAAGAGALDAGVGRGRVADARRLGAGRTGPAVGEAVAGRPAGRVLGDLAD